MTKSELKDYEALRKQVTRQPEYTHSKFLNIKTPYQEKMRQEDIIKRQKMKEAETLQRSVSVLAERRRRYTEEEDWKDEMTKFQEERSKTFKIDRKYAKYALGKLELRIK